MLEGYVPFPEEFAARYRRLGYWETKTFGERLDEWAARYGERTALVSGEQRLSYAELRSRALRLAAGLAGLGVRREDRVLVQLPNTWEFVVLSLALFRLGALPIMALPAHHGAEILRLLQFSDAVAYCGPASWRGFDYAAMIGDIAPQAPALKHVLIVGAGFDEIARTPEGPLPEGPRPEDVLLFMLSGGTTGLPKLIAHTHEDYACVMNHATALAGLAADSVFLAVLPVSHNFTFATPGVLGALSRGARLVLSPTPSPESAFPLIERERVTNTGCTPAVAIQWLESPLRAKHDLSSLRAMLVGGSRLPAEVAKRIEREIGATVQQIYGMAEGLNNLTRLDDAEELRLDTQGRPACPADEVRIVGPDGSPVAPGEPGELLTRGPYTVRGYWRAPEQNAQAFTADGFYRSGDLVCATPSGNFRVEGRIKDLINRGGEKISAEEIEGLMLRHPAVRNAAAVAMPCRVMGERVCACVIRRPEASLTLDELRGFLARAGIAHFKLPERLELMENFPLTAVGKVSKKALREGVAAKLAAAA
ncbi:MAG: AMP-binding protein [Burkholderiales bacterium]|nr:AMP-binding protein [Burkholderiales bacterium]